MNTRTRREVGHAVVEATLLAPWIFFLFVGVLDFGFYAYAIISTQNAARVAALYTSANSLSVANQAVACTYALDEMSSLPNVRSLSNCNSLPLIVTATAVTGPDGRPASQVAITYQTLPMIPMPGLTDRLQITRIAVMRVKR